MAISILSITELLKNSSYFFRFCDTADSGYKNCKDLLSLYDAEQELEAILNGDNFKINTKKISEAFQFDANEIKLTLRLMYSLCFRYLNDSEFNSIRMQADNNNKYGNLSMDEYFIAPSYIPEFDLRKRETLINAETEESHTKIDKSTRKSHNFLPHNFLSNSFLSNSLFDNVNRIAIIGNPGVGKSTYARWMCYSWAKQQLDIKGILIHINLRELNFSTENSLVDYVLKRYLKGCNTNQLRKILSTIELVKDFCFVLDGFDELDDSKQKNLKKDLDELNSNYSFILLSRPYGLINNQGFNWDYLYQIDGFNSGNIENYINKFLTINNRNATIQSLLNIISQNRVLADYAHNPLMLSYITYIFLEEGEKGKLIYVQSQYELQDLVYACIRAYEEKKQTREKLDSLIDEASAFAYQMEIKKQIVFSGNTTDNKSREIAEYLNGIGLGKMYQSSTSEWKYSFNSLTFQEFLASKYLLNYITTDAFLYLSGERYFMNLIRMLTGCLSLNHRNTQVNEIQQSLYTQFENNDRNLKLWGIYIMCLSEVLKEHLIKKFDEDNQIEELYTFYCSLYHDEQYQSIVLDAFLRIYSKLKLHQQNKIQDIILNDIRKLLLTGREDFGFYAESIEILILKLRLSEDLLFVGKIITLIATVKEHLTKNHNDIEYFVAVAQRLLFIMNDVLCIAPKDNLIHHKDILLPVLDDTMEEFLVPKAKLSVHFTTIKELIPQINKSVTIISKQKRFTKALLEKIQTLAIEIYQLGFLLKNEEIKEKQDIQIIKSAVETLLYRISDIRKKEGYDYEIEQIGELVIQGLVDLDCPELYDLMFDALYKLDLEYVMFDFPASSDKALFEYLDLLLQSCKESEDVDEIGLLKLINSVNCIRNIRNQFAKIREKFSDVLRDYIIVHSAIFKTHSGGYELSKENTNFSEVIRKFNRISDLSIMGSEMFSYDKQYIIDNLCEFKDYCYFRNYFIPLVLSKDFNLYQENYWTEIIKQYTVNKKDLSRLLTILRNPKIYYYASNLEQLYLILCEIEKLEFTDKKDEPKRFPEILLEILSKCLILIKRSENIQIDENIKRNIIYLCVILTKKFDLKSIFHKPFDGLTEGKDMLLFVLLYSYTKNMSYDIQVDYDVWLCDSPRELRDLIVTLIELFMEYDKLKTTEFETLYPILGENTVFHIKRMLSLRVGLLNEWMVDEFEKKLNKGTVQKNV
jgi:Predicted NTPase (NACHT family)